ncbi:anti-sigma factor antagonist [Robbsia andropogonis]|uniref:Anti-sigma factor antagonist n=1 Tax=Robbsia andropogonis TaxID=28092 RepID=A0A0F5JVP3_9BURK|nr:STAS domain-containing protein [Robbsia andropogonis]KKB61936.1 anti-sigma factor antagonist [Robbsia andropogonis]MCP1120787.1 STAS domain-containing protein [Robbsia andropogonis]MCP1130538.1 STAS domain-containing protein [Robbsia andropogonis]
MQANKSLEQFLTTEEENILKEWVAVQLGGNAQRGLISESEVREASRSFLSLFTKAVTRDYDASLSGENWDALKSHLVTVSGHRATQGFTPSETAMFVFSLKEPLFKALRARVVEADALTDALWKLTITIDKLGLLTVEAYQATRQRIIERQQQELLDLTTPVVRLWDSVVALPLIGTLDSERTQVVMESLLESIVANEAAIAIIDITGVPTVDTLVAQHLLKTVAAAHLMGAECIISGIRPQIAQTIVHLGVDLGNVVTKATLEDALKLALKRVGMNIVREQRVEAR